VSVFLVPAHPGSLGNIAVKLVCLCVCVQTISYNLWHYSYNSITKLYDTEIYGTVTALGNTFENSNVFSLLQKCISYCQQVYAGSKALLQQNSLVFNWVGLTVGEMALEVVVAENRRLEYLQECLQCLMNIDSNVNTLQRQCLCFRRCYH